MKKFILPLVLCSLFANANPIEGYEAYQNGNYEVAQKQFTEAIKAEPNDATLYYNRALTEFKLGNIEAGNADLRIAKILVGE